jgi:hypothetical protein
MPYSNLTSVLDTATYTPIMNKAVVLQADLLPFSINLTPEEISRMYKMKENRQTLGERGLQIATDNPTLVPNYLNLAEAKVDMTRYINSFALEMKLRQIIGGLQHGRMASGSEVLQFIKGFYNALQGAAEQNQPGAQALLDELKVFYDLPAQPDGGEPDPVPVV